MTLSQIRLLTEFDITDYRFPWGICNGCGMPTGDAYSSGHLVLSHFGTCMCSNVETNLSWTCLVSGLLNFEHPSVLLFCFSLHISIVSNLILRTVMCIVGIPLYSMTKIALYVRTYTRIVSHSVINYHILCISTNKLRVIVPRRRDLIFCIFTFETCCFFVYPRAFGRRI